MLLIVESHPLDMKQILKDIPFIGSFSLLDKSPMDKTPLNGHKPSGYVVNYNKNYLKVHFLLPVNMKKIL